jgi:hypothetical protein
MNSDPVTTGVALRRRSAPQEPRGDAWKLVAITVLVVAGTLVLSVPAGVAKEKKPATKTVSGVVFDDAQNSIAGATVELTDVQTSKVLEIYSQEDGHYQFTDLLFSHDYKIKAMYKGSSSEVRQVSSMDMRSRPILDLVIPKPPKAVTSNK